MPLHVRARAAHCCISAASEASALSVAALCQAQEAPLPPSQRCHTSLKYGSVMKIMPWMDSSTCRGGAEGLPRSEGAPMEDGTAAASAPLGIQLALPAWQGENCAAAGCNAGRGARLRSPTRCWPGKGWRSLGATSRSRRRRATCPAGSGTPCRLRRGRTGGQGRESRRAGQHDGMQSCAVLRRRGWHGGSKALFRSRCSSTAATEIPKPRPASPSSSPHLPAYCRNVDRGGAGTGAAVSARARAQQQPAVQAWIDATVGLHACLLFAVALSRP